MIDIGNADGVSEAVGEANGIEGGITDLPHCAGVLQRLLPPGKLELREWDLVNSIDLRGAYLVHAWGRCDHSTRLGRWHEVCTAACRWPAKAAVIHLATCLAAEWGPRKCAGERGVDWVYEAPALDRGVGSEGPVERDVCASAALGRLVEADEVAAAARFLLSRAASGITGINLPVDAGHLAATPWQA